MTEFILLPTAQDVNFHLMTNTLARMEIDVAKLQLHQSTSLHLYLSIHRLLSINHLIWKKVIYLYSRSALRKLLFLPLPAVTCENNRNRKQNLFHCRLGKKKTKHLRVLQTEKKSYSLPTFPFCAKHLVGETPFRQVAQWKNSWRN